MAVVSENSVCPSLQIVMDDNEHIGEDLHLFIPEINSKCRKNTFFLSQHQMHSFKFQKDQRQFSTKKNTLKT